MFMNLNLAIQFLNMKKIVNKKEKIGENFTSSQTITKTVTRKITPPSQIFNNCTFNYYCSCGKMEFPKENNKNYFFLFF